VRALAKTIERLADDADVPSFPVNRFRIGKAKRAASRVASRESRSMIFFRWPAPSREAIFSLALLKRKPLSARLECHLRGRPYRWFLNGCVPNGFPRRNDANGSLARDLFGSSKALISVVGEVTSARTWPYRAPDEMPADEGHCFIQVGQCAFQIPLPRNAMPIPSAFLQRVPLTLALVAVRLGLLPCTKPQVAFYFES